MIGRNILTGPKWAWKEMFAFPEMIGTPSRRGRGIVRAMPTLVPTHNKPCREWGRVNLSSLGKP